MQCPDCSSKLTETFISTKGARVAVDVCRVCGGVWTDQAEANFFDEKELDSAGIFPASPQPIKPNQNRGCPKDSSVLIRLQGESVPEDVVVLRCPTCGGHWFSYPHLKKFKQAQKVKLAFLKTWHIPLASAYAVLLPVLLLLILTGGLIVTVRSIQNRQLLESEAKGLVNTPVVVGISPTEVVISFTTQRKVSSSLTYWPRGAPASLRQTVFVSLSPATIHTVKLSNLTPRTTYSYQITVVDVKPVTTVVYSLSTQY